MKPVSGRTLKKLLLLLFSLAFLQDFLSAQIVTVANVALNKLSSSSSVETPVVNASKAFDGNPNTYFSSEYGDNEWISVDLGRSFLIDKVTLTWKENYARDFDVQFSANGSFTDLPEDSIQIRNNVQNTANDAGVNILKMKSNTIARYVRMQGVHRATMFGYAISEFQVSGATFISGALPVTVTGLMAVGQSNTNLLEWTTTTEANNAGFSIERSSDGAHFSTIGWVTSRNQGTVLTNYAYADKLMLTARNYYRLKIIDLNGKSAYTQAVLIGTAINSSTRIYPIPVKDQFTVEYKGTAGESIQIAVMNTAGQPIYTNTLAIAGNQQTMIINRTSAMKPGLYFLSIRSTGNKAYSSSIILQ